MLTLSLAGWLAGWSFLVSGENPGIQQLSTSNGRRCRLESINRKQYCVKKIRYALKRERLESPKHKIAGRTLSLVYIHIVYYIQQSRKRIAERKREEREPLFF